MNSANTIPDILIELFPPDASLLLVTACRLTTDQMLEDISEADYGMETKEHFAALRQLRDREVTPSPLHWIPGEVLMLKRWSEVSEADTYGHVVRAFSCAALLQAGLACRREGPPEMENATLVQAIESALHLGLGLPEATGRLLTWAWQALPTHDRSRPYIALGLTCLAVLIYPDLVPANDADELGGFVEDVELRTLDPLGICTRDMFGNSFLDHDHFSQRHSVWKSLAWHVAMKGCGGSEGLQRVLLRISQ